MFVLLTTINDRKVAINADSISRIEAEVENDGTPYTIVTTDDNTEIMTYEKFEDVLDKWQTVI